jgi:hypothetical protein
MGAAAITLDDLALDPERIGELTHGPRVDGGHGGPPH